MKDFLYVHPLAGPYPESAAWPLEELLKPVVKLKHKKISRLREIAIQKNMERSVELKKQAISLRAEIEERKKR